MRTASRVLIAGFGLGLGALGAAGSETVVCDPELVSEKKSASAYRHRGDRCEGEYALEVSRDLRLQIVSFTESFEDYSLDAADDLLVEWSPPAGDATLTLRGQSLDLSGWGSVYRMDTAVAAERRSFRWPNQVLSMLRLGHEDIGVVGWIETGSEARRVYLPLRIRQRSAAVRDGRYRLVVVPRERLDEVRVTLTPVSADDTLEPPLRDAEPLGRGYYPALAPTALEISGLPRAGLYRIDLKAHLSSSGTAETSLWLYHGVD